MRKSFSHTKSILVRQKVVPFGVDATMTICFFAIPKQIRKQRTKKSLLKISFGQIIEMFRVLFVLPPVTINVVARRARNTRQTRTQHGWDQCCSRRGGVVSFCGALGRGTHCTSSKKSIHNFFLRGIAGTHFHGRMRPATSISTTSIQVRHASRDTLRHRVWCSELDWFYVLLHRIIVLLLLLLFRLRIIHR